MEIIIATAIFIIGIALVIKGGDTFVDSAAWIARAAGIPSFIIGATIVSIATTMPEMLVSSMAAYQGKIDMAIGNAVGSVTANTALIMAIAYIFMKVTVERRNYLPQSIMLIACSAVLWLGSVHGSLALWACFVLVAIFFVFMALNLRLAKIHSAFLLEQKKMHPCKKEIFKNIFFFILGAAMITGGSHLLIVGGSSLAVAFGVPERIIAVTLVAVGTSLPEFVTTLSAIHRHESALSVGNIIGANIIDLALILPICSIISGKLLPISDIILKLDLPVCFGTVVLALVPLLLRGRSSKIHGIVLLACYVAYLYATF